VKQISITSLPKQDYGKRVNRKHKPIQEKESNKWLTSYQKTEQSQRQLPNTLLVNISDRESDIYEYFELATRTDDAAKVLVRASHNRLVDHPEKYLWNFMDKQTISGTLTIEVPRQNKKPKRQANLAIRFAQVTIKKAKNITASNIPDSISAWAILAQEINPPHQVEAVSWLLLTTVPIHSFDETVEKVQWYTIRWQIEIFHKVLKSGCKTEKRQLQTVEKLVKCLFVDAIIAWRILLLTKLGREVPNLPCSVIFEDYEWKALNGYIHHTTELIDKEPTLQQAIRMVDKLGGFLERNGDGEPGVMTIWRGMMRLNDIAESYLIFFSPSNSLPRTYG